MSAAEAAEAPEGDEIGEAFKRLRAAARTNAHAHALKADDARAIIAADRDLLHAAFSAVKAATDDRTRNDAPAFPRGPYSCPTPTCVLLEGHAGLHCFPPLVDTLRAEAAALRAERDEAHAFATEVREALGDDYAGPEAHWRARSLGSIGRLRAERDAVTMEARALAQSIAGRQRKAVEEKLAAAESALSEARRVRQLRGA